MSTVSINGYLALGVGYNGAAFSEFAGAGYARTAISLASRDGVTLANVAGITFGPGPVAEWSVVNWVALYDAPTGGNGLIVWPLNVPAYAVATGTLTLASGAIVLAVPQLVALLSASASTNLPPGTLLGSVGAGGSVSAGTGLTVGNGSLRAYVASGLQPANNLTDVANPSLARANINQGDLALGYAAVIATDCSAGNVFHVVLTGNAVLGAAVNLRPGASYIWRLIQDSVGGRTLSYDPSFKFASGAAPALTTTPNATDILSAFSDGVNVYAALMKDMR